MNLGSASATEDYASHSMVPGSAECVVTNAGWSSEESVNLNDLTLDPGQYVVVMWPYSR